MVLRKFNCKMGGMETFYVIDRGFDDLCVPRRVLITVLVFLYMTPRSYEQILQEKKNLCL